MKKGVYDKFIAKLKNQVKTKAKLNKSINIYNKMTVNKNEILNRISRTETGETLKQQINNSNLCCLIRQKAERLTEYKFRLEAWAENYQETAKAKIKKLTEELKVLGELWSKADHWGKYEACSTHSNEKENYTEKYLVV